MQCHAISTQLDWDAGSVGPPSVNAGCALRACAERDQPVSPGCQLVLSGDRWNEYLTLGCGNSTGVFNEAALPECERHLGWLRGRDVRCRGGARKQRHHGAHLRARLRCSKRRWPEFGRDDESKASCISVTRPRTQWPSESLANIDILSRSCTHQGRRLFPSTPRRTVARPLDLPARSPMVYVTLNETFQCQSQGAVKLSSECLASGVPRGPLAQTWRVSSLRWAKTAT